MNPWISSSSSPAVMIIVDTNVVAEMMRASPAPAVVSWLNDQEASTLFLMAITIGEIGYGLELLPRGKRRLRLEEDSSG